MAFTRILRAALTSPLAAAITVGPPSRLARRARSRCSTARPTGWSIAHCPIPGRHERARRLDADPKNVARIIELGVAQSGARQFREAIATFTRGLEIEPTTRCCFDGAASAALGARIRSRVRRSHAGGFSRQLDLRHLVPPGVLQYLRGEFADAAASFARAQPIAPDAGELAGSTDWLWMSLSRAAAAPKPGRCSIGGRTRSL